MPIFRYKERKHEIIPVPRYEFSEEIHSYIKSAFGENPALKNVWKKEPDISKPKSAQLVLEAAQYFLLSKLSTHLTDYFAVEDFKKANLKKAPIGAI